MAQVRELTGGRGADYTFEVFGSAETVKAAYDMCGKNGTVTIVGIAPIGAEAPINAVDIVRNEKTMRGTYYGSARSRTDMPTMVDLYLSGKLNLDDLVVRHYSLDQINEAYGDMGPGRNRAGRDNVQLDDNYPLTPGPSPSGEGRNSLPRPMGEGRGEGKGRLVMPRLETLSEVQRRTLEFFPCLEHDTAPWVAPAKTLAESKGGPGDLRRATSARRQAL